MIASGAGDGSSYRDVIRRSHQHLPAAGQTASLSTPPGEGASASAFFPWAGRECRCTLLLQPSNPLVQPHPRPVCCFSFLLLEDLGGQGLPSLMSTIAC